MAANDGGDDQWHIRTASRPIGPNGETEVTICASGPNVARPGFATTAAVTWYPGAERADVEAAALGLTAVRLEAIAAALRAEGRRKLLLGDNALR